jgi:coenzyme F420 hydrogenase subunit beta
MHDTAPLMPPQRKLCTDCGLSRTAAPKRCAQACQFIQPDYPRLEQAVQGRRRQMDTDELFFGPHLAMWQAWLEPAQSQAQWSGIATSLAQALLEADLVDAVIAMEASPHDRWAPQPVVITEAAQMARCRGMRMGYAPLLAEVEPALAAGHKRLAVIGIPCQVYPLRAIEDSLRQTHGLTDLFVIGIPCSDNTSTEHFHRFLSLLSDRPEQIDYLEFRADYRVELREAGGRVRLIPFLDLPISQLPDDFFPLTCRTCVDYTNVLSDITVGYMGGRGQQWVLVRNAQGQRMLDLLRPRLSLRPVSSAGRRASAVRGFLANTQRAAGGLPLRRAPTWLRPVINWLMPRIGPRGVEFARARVEMKAIETVLHLQRHVPARMAHMVPAHVWAIAQRYGLRAAPASPLSSPLPSEPA